MDLLASVTWADLLALLVLAVGALAGFTQGIIRYAAASLSVIVAFVLASQLKASAADAFAFWTAYAPEVRELILFVAIYVIFVVAFWFLIRTVARGTQLPVARLVNEIGGAILGVLFGALVLVFFVVALASLYGQPGAAAAAEASDAQMLRTLYLALDASPLVDTMRAVLLPLIGLVVSPFVPPDVRAIIRRA